MNPIVKGIHPVASLFPLLDEHDARFTQLLASVRSGGQYEPIVVDDDGRVLDGRNRLRACELLGIEPNVVRFANLNLGSVDPAQYALDKNLARRDLSDDQRVTILARFEQYRVGPDARREAGRLGGRGHKAMADSPELSPGPAERTTRHKLADAAHVSEHKARQAMDVARDIGLADAVINGKAKLTAAAKEIRRIRRPMTCRRISYVTSLMRSAGGTLPISPEQIRNELETEWRAPYREGGLVPKFPEYLYGDDVGTAIELWRVYSRVVARHKPEQAAPSVAPTVGPEEQASLERRWANTETEKETLPKRLQAKVDRLVNERHAILNAAFAVQLETRFRNEIDKRFAKEKRELDERLARVEKREQASWAHEQKLDARMTQADFRLVAGCLHPDTQPPDRQARYAQAFVAFNDLSRWLSPMASERKRNGWS